jgi:hypothetical protein
MHKGMGKKQQIRGHKRAKKVLNRKLNRKKSDVDTVDYIKHVQNWNAIKEEIANTSEEENA